MGFFYSEIELFEPIAGDVKADVCIIGGGIAALVCAYELSGRGRKVCVLEANRIASGETGRSTAMITYGHDLIYSRLIKKHGKTKAAEYLRLNQEGCARIAEIIREHSIDCDYKERDLVLFSTTEKGKKDITAEIGAYARLGVAVNISPEIELPYPVTAAFGLPRQAAFNPVKFCRALCEILSRRGVTIHEKTPVIEPPHKNVLKVGGYSVEASSFVIATHYPYHNLRNLYFAKLYQHRSHVIALKRESNFRQMYESAEQSGFEYREAEGTLLLGGGNVRTGKSKVSQYDRLKEHAFTQLSAREDDILAQFSAQDVITFDGFPMAGQFCAAIDNVYVVSGFNKWGISTSAACAKIIYHVIEGARIDNIFCPQRLYFLRSPIKSLKNAGVVLCGLLSAVFSPDAKSFKRLKNGEGAVVVKRGKRLGAYRDDKGELHIVEAVCPHMGCALTFNRDETSWDCPCHGSRFGIDGEILNNPSLHRVEKG